MSIYLDSKVAELKNLGCRVRRVASPDRWRPMATCEEWIYIGGDCPAAMDCRTPNNVRNVLASVRRMIVAEIEDGNGCARADKIWSRIKQYEGRW